MERERGEAGAELLKLLLDEWFTEDLEKIGALVRVLEGKEGRKERG